LVARGARLLETYGVKNYRSALSLIFAVSLALVASTRAESSWQTDYRSAQDKAKVGHKLLLVDFTGSDWCGWCKRLKAEVFSKPEFQDYASKNLVLLEIDFPRRKPQSDAIKRQNQELAEEYQIQGFPTIIVLNSEGRKVGEFGYVPGGPSAFIAELERLRKS
jgi:thioredoxin-related protein